MTTLTSITGRIGSDRRVLMAVVGIALVAGAFGVASWVSAPQWVPAASGVALDLSGRMTERLTEDGIEHRLEGGGREILVSEDDLARARVSLARDGLATGSRPGLELFDQPTWGWNDFTQRINYRRALEGELERTIGRIGGVEHANVHIAIGERSAFRRADARVVTASVVLAMRGDGVPSADVVRGVAQLVSSSVDGLAADNVSIHDVSGRVWSEPADATPSGLSARQLRMQREVETYLEQKAEAIIADVVGPGNARVRVSAALNFDRVERTTQSVDPERQVLASEQKAEIIPGTDGGAASTNVANTYENSRSTEVFSGAVGSVERLTVAVVVNEPQPAAGAATVAPRDAAALLQLESLVRRAIGLDSTRGDDITVVSAPFERVEVLPIVEAPPPAGVGALVERYQRPALHAAGIVAMLLIGVLTLNALRAPATTAPALAGVATLSAPHGPAAGGGGSALPAAPPRPAPRISFPEADTQVRDRVVQTVDKDPEAAARLVKNWIKEG